MLTDRHAAVHWARDVLRANPLVLDTETTGLDDGEICQIAIIDATGDMAFNSLVKPVRPIPVEATEIHGITNLMVAKSPTWKDLAATVADILRGREIVVYNAEYDLRMIYRSHQLSGAQTNGWRTIANWHCAMEMYAQFYGDWSDYHQSYRWQKLTVACAQQGIDDPVAPAHSALGDCLRTLALVKVMAGAADEAVAT